MSKTRENIIVGAIGLLMFGGMIAWLSYNPNSRVESNDEFFLVRADGNVFAGENLTLVPVMDSYRVSADIALYRNHSGWTQLTPLRLRSLCGNILTHAMRESEISRDQVYRVDFGIGVAHRDETDFKEVRYPITVRDGACISETEADLSRLSLPAPLQQWSATDLAVSGDGVEANVTFEPYRDLDYDAAYENFDPEVACTAILLEQHQSVRIPLENDNLSALNVTAEHRRGSKIFGFSTTRTWKFQVAGGVCLDNIDGVPS